MINREYNNRVGGKAIDKLVTDGRVVMPITMQEVVTRSRHVKVPSWAVTATIYMLGGGGNGSPGGWFTCGRGGLAGDWRKIHLHQLHGGEIIVIIGSAGAATKIRYYSIFSEAEPGLTGANGTHTGLGAQTYYHAKNKITTHPAGSRKKYELRGSDSVTVPGMDGKNFGGGGAGGNKFRGAAGRGAHGACYIFFSNVP